MNETKLARFRQTVVQLLDAVIDYNYNKNCEELHMLRTYFYYLATDQHINVMALSMLNNRRDLLEHNSTFVTTHLGFRACISKFIDNARLDALIIAIWDKNDAEFRATVWQWIDKIINDLAFP